MATRNLLIAALFTLALSGVAAPVLAQSPEDMNARIDQLFGEHDTLADAFDAITAAVRDEDYETVAAFVKYPFAVTIDGEDYVIDDEAVFVDWYDDIMTPEIVEAVGYQDYGLMLANSDGVMFGNGQMWLTAICTDNSCGSSYWVISAINQDTE